MIQHNIILQQHASFSCLLPLSKIELQGCLQAMLVVCTKEKAHVSLLLVGERESAILNQRYLQCTGPTNILSFPTLSYGMGTGRLGDLALCVPVFWRETLLYKARPHWIPYTPSGAWAITSGRL